MVKFGRHLRFFLENEHSGSTLYVVPYSHVKSYIEKTSTPSPLPEEEKDELSVATNSNQHHEQFITEWRKCLQNATDDFNSTMTSLWKKVFEGISQLPESRGAPPDPALRLYVATVGHEAVQDLLSALKAIHSTALTNSEALRKLVKKFDKDAGRKKKGCRTTDDKNKQELLLSPTLLPELYGASFTVGQAMLESGMEVLRLHLQFDDEDETEHELEREDDDYGHDSTDNDAIHPRNNGLGSMNRRERKHTDEVAERCKAELSWLKSLTSSIVPDEICHLVSHRGFHFPNDRTDLGRPLENTLHAYEAAWTCGVRLCECDVALTKDEKLVLCHDEDFSRLALDSDGYPTSKVKVRELTFRELISLPLKSGSRPPLLFDVLRSAAAIGNGSQLVIEIKPGNAEAGTALARMFLRYPKLMASCAIVMSFDAFAMHNLRREMKSVLEQLDSRPADLLMKGSFVSLPTSMSLGNVGLVAGAVNIGSGSNANLSTTSRGGMSHNANSNARIDSLGYQFDSGVGLSDHAKKDSFHFSPFNSYATPLQQQQNGAGAGVIGSSGNSKANLLPPSMSNLPEETKTNNNAISSSHNFPVPKLMVLTVADPPKIPCELWLDITSDISPVDHWLHANGEQGDSLDGIYLQYQREMMLPEGVEALRKLSEKYKVGVWGYSGKDPDDLETFNWLVKECKVSYVNSSLPKKFKKGAGNNGSVGDRGVSTLT